VIFTNIGGGLIHFSFGGPGGYVLLCGVLAAAVALCDRGLCLDWFTCPRIRRQPARRRTV